MQKFTTILWLLWALLVLFLTRNIDAQTLDSAAVERARPHVNAGNAKWCEAHRTGDAKALASLFVPEGAILGGSGRMYLGPQSIDSLFTRIFAKYGTCDMTITTLDLWVIDSLAFECGKYTQKLHHPPDADTTTGTGMYFEIWKEQPDGTWKIWRDAGIDPSRAK